MKDEQLCDLLNYHIQECRDRYLAVEKRLQRMEILIVTVLLSGFGLAVELILKIERFIK